MSTLPARDGRAAAAALPADWTELLAALPDGVAVVDADGVIIHANDELTRLAGYPPGALDGAPVALLVPPELRDRHAAHLVRYLERPVRRPMSQARNIECRRRDGSVLPVAISIAPATIDGRTVVVCAVRDDSVREASMRDLTHRATHDQLTGLPNRAAVLNELGRALRRSRLDGSHVAVLFVDIDGFKEVNDRLGHLAGDAFLAAVARRLEVSVRPGDAVGRVGGDEFLIVCHGVAAEAATEVGRRVVDAVVDEADGLHPDLRVGASVGIAVGDGDAVVDTLLHDADEAMYAAKRRGGGVGCAR